MNDLQRVHVKKAAVTPLVFVSTQLMVPPAAVQKLRSLRFRFPLQKPLRDLKLNSNEVASAEPAAGMQHTEPAWGERVPPKLNSHTLRKRRTAVQRGPQRMHAEPGGTGLREAVAVDVADGVEVEVAVAEDEDVDVALGVEEAEGEADADGELEADGLTDGVTDAEGDTGVNVYLLTEFPGAPRAAIREALSASAAFKGAVAVVVTVWAAPERAKVPSAFLVNA